MISSRISSRSCPWAADNTGSNTMIAPSNRALVEACRYRHIAHSLWEEARGEPEEESARRCRLEEAAIHGIHDDRAHVVLIGYVVYAQELLELPRANALAKPRMEIEDHVGFRECRVDIIHVHPISPSALHTGRKARRRVAPDECRIDGMLWNAWQLISGKVEPLEVHELFESRARVGVRKVERQCRIEHCCGGGKLGTLATRALGIDEGVAARE